MERLESVDQDRVDHWREYNNTSAATEDATLDPLDRRDREEVLAGTHLKRDDDILIVDCIDVRVVGPGSGRTMVLVYNPSWFGDEAVGMDLSDAVYITDRAPADEAEEPMPVFPESEVP